ncbi:urease accessory protein UreF [Marinobacter psychrophilus]|uniref:urease accessory protein UreF n=1 Tax=Marinobacter psychrophilus TaxID=330734 RepID=UPI001B4D4002|nr:urease accessory UreF family protein [Marinobacter psychrophilus]MBQ0762231.1 urease accessory protein UreF [Marinobacter psychrophilus]MBQ0844593.1 urease accessory protein UreF [Marinobacter psychrophilus]
MTIDSQPGASSDLALLGLMQLVSPALPIGAFAWSQGLESAFELGWVKTEADLQEWLEGVLEDGLSRCELPLLARLQTAWATEDAQAIAQWNTWLQATRETAELSDEDTRLGAALVTLLRNLGLLPDANLIPNQPGYITMFAWVAHYRQVPQRQTLIGFAWAWLENQLSVACKALPLGHTAAQRITEHMRPLLVKAVEVALQREDHDLGPILPGLALGSALHETQYSRLFRS